MGVGGGSAVGSEDGLAGGFGVGSIGVGSVGDRIGCGGVDCSIGVGVGSCVLLMLNCGSQSV